MCYLHINNLIIYPEERDIYIGEEGTGTFGGGRDGSLKEKEADTPTDCIEASALSRAVSGFSVWISKHCKTVA